MCNLRADVPTNSGIRPKAFRSVAFTHNRNGFFFFMVSCSSLSLKADRVCLHPTIIIILSNAIKHRQMMNILRVYLDPVSARVFFFRPAVERCISAFLSVSACPVALLHHLSRVMEGYLHEPRLVVSSKCMQFLFLQQLHHGYACKVTG